MSTPSDDPNMTDQFEKSEQTGANEFAQWLSVEQAAARCKIRGLPRTGKTIRKWAKRSYALPHGEGDVISRRKDTPNGKYRWLVELASLDKKIDEELQDMKIDASLQLSEDEKLNLSSEHVQTGTNPSEPVPSEDDEEVLEETDEEEDKPVRTSSDRHELIQALEKQIEFLKDELTHRRKTDEALRNVINGLQTNAEAQRFQAENETRRLNLLEQGIDPDNVKIHQGE